MAEDLINQQWQAFKQLIRGKGLFGQSKIKALIERGKQRQKPTLVDTIVERRETDALDEYRRRFASAAGRNAPVPPPAPIAPQAFGEPSQEPVAAQSSGETSQAPLEPYTPPPPNIVRMPSVGFMSAPSFETLQARESGHEQAPPPEFQEQQPEPAQPEPPAEPERLPERVQQAARQRRRVKAANQGERRRSRPGWGSRLSRRLGEAMNSLPPSLAHDLRVLRQRKNELIAAAAACIAVFGGGYIYQGMHAGHGKPAAVSHTATATATATAGKPAQAAAKNKPEKPAGPKKKTFYDRLLPETANAASGTPAAPATAAAVAEAPENSTPAAQDKAAQASAPDGQSGGASAPEPPASPAVSASTPIEVPAKGAAKAPDPAPPAISASADEPTWVKAERYLPDGTRTDVPRPAAGPLPGEGEARKPVLAAVNPAAAVPGSSPGKQESVLAGGYFAQVKSNQNRSASEAELAAVAEKYKSVLGETPLSVRSADLKSRGIWYRVLIGPVESHDEAGSICKRLKGAGLQDCIVQKLD